MRCLLPFLLNSFIALIRWGIIDNGALSSLLLSLCLSSAIGLVPPPLIHSFLLLTSIFFFQRMKWFEFNWLPENSITSIRNVSNNIHLSKLSIIYKWCTDSMKNKWNSLNQIEDGTNMMELQFIFPLISKMKIER